MFTISKALFHILEFGILKLSIFGDTIHSQFANHECKMFIVREQRTIWDAGSIDFQGRFFQGYILGYVGKIHTIKHEFNQTTTKPTPFPPPR